MTYDAVQRLGEVTENAFFVIGAAILLIEIAKGLFTKRLRGRDLLDIVASLSTLIPLVAFETFVMTSAYVAFYTLSYSYVTWTLPVSVWTLALTLLACDFVYYWEHRIAHQVRLFWTQHAVHHSSRQMNASIAIRFGPAEGVLSALCHLPLIFLGFPPELVFFGIVVVLAYQTWIHTELIGKLPVLDAFLNTPANHRVHHGSNATYLDKNYGGILIVWDRLFGTYRREEARPTYGLARDFDSVNPLCVWFSEVPAFLRDLGRARSAGGVWNTLFGKPDWTPTGPDKQS